jgi:hypothetical protein
MSIHRSHLTGAALFLVLAGAGLACGGAHAEAKPAATASANPSPMSPTTAPGSTNQQAPAQRSGPAQQGSNRGQGQGEEADAELVVSRDVVARCPTLQLVRAHVGEFDPDMVWLAVLESIADCMSQSGPLSGQNLGVSGDEEHRHVVREVLGARGIAPTRVVAKAVSAQGAAECQGGQDCNTRRVEITIVTP